MNGQVLVADDDATNRRLLQAIFRAEGLDVVLADGGEAALARVAEAVPSVILLDLHMPGLGGLETLARLRSAAPQVPVVMLTSHGEIAQAVEATKLGAYDFLTRPIPNEKLVLTVRRALERQQ